MNSLKRCPFCGKYPSIITNGCFYQIRCENDECWILPHTPQFYTSLNVAIEAWNRRIKDE